MPVKSKEVAPKAYADVMGILLHFFINAAISYQFSTTISVNLTHYVAHLKAEFTASYRSNKVG